MKVPEDHTDMEDQMAGLRTAKKELRTLMRLKLAQLTPELLQQQSTAATQALLSLPEYKDASRIAIYLSMPQGEVVTRDIVNDAFRQCKQVFVPYIYNIPSHDGVRKSSFMDMVTLHSQRDYGNLERDAWGIPSIRKDSVGERHRILEDVEDISEDVAEGISKQGSDSESRWVAFDKSLARLGHGKGFYDYFLEQYHRSKLAPMPFLVGLSLDVQLLPDGLNVPTNISDQKLDALVVGDGTIVRP